MKKEQKKGLLKESDNIISQLIKITKTSDLLKAKPIIVQILKFGRNDVDNEISKSVIKCAIGLGIELSNYESQLLVEDLVDVYKFDSIEDIQVCLKNGRQGKYGKNYNKLNMIVFSEWMSKHLEQKSIERENQYRGNKHDWMSNDDYLKAVKEGAKRQAKEKEIEDSNKQNIFDYNNFKMKYESGKGNESTEGTISPDPKLRNN